MPVLNTLSYFEMEEEPPGEAALSPGTLIFTQTNRSLHLGDLWFQPSPSSPRLLLWGRGMLPTRADTAPHGAHPGGSQHQPSGTQLNGGPAAPLAWGQAPASKTRL